MTTDDALDQPAPVLSVVVPAYREATTIKSALERMRDAFTALDVSHEVVLVSDGNDDGTEVVAAEVPYPELRVLHYTPNRGKGYALRHGVEHARGSLVGFLDADLDIPPESLVRLLDQLRTTGVDTVVGSKIHPGSSVAYPPLRRFQSRVFRRLIRTLFRLDVADTQTGCKMFRREVLDTCMPLVRAEGYAFDLELLVLANDAGYRVSEGPIVLDYQFATTTGVRAVGQVLRDVAALARRRREGRRRGTWITPAARATPR